MLLIWCQGISRLLNNLYIQHKWIVVFVGFDCFLNLGIYKQWTTLGEEVCTDSCPRILSVPRSEQSLEGNCELRGTNNVQGQLSVHISEAKSCLLSLSFFKYSLSQRKQRRENKPNQKKTRRKTRRLLGAFKHCFLDEFPNFLIIKISKKTLHFEVCSPDGGYWLWAGIIGWTLGHVIGSRVTIPPFTREEKYLRIITRAIHLLADPGENKMARELHFIRKKIAILELLSHLNCIS